MNKSKPEHEQDYFLKGNISKVNEPPKIRVIIRKRPLSKKEIEKGEIDIIELRSKANLIVKEQKTKVDMSKYIEEHNFFFDNVFDEDSSNQDIYLEAVRPMITSAFTSKAKVTCFAYGQTGSGKTHTMMGPVSNFSNGQVIVPGLYLLSGYDIFNLLSKEEYKHLHVFISFYEIYCGKLFDLLNDRNMLIAREDGKGNICIGDLSERQAFSLNDLMKVIEIGLRSRTVGVTGANSDSSRSHAIIQISLKSKQNPVGNRSLMTNSRLMSLSNSSNNGLIGSANGYMTHGKITFIDLAGSERAQDISDNNKQTRIDGAEINKSLLALKECIRALDQNKSHTPFRGSKLTMVLRDSFVGGNCKTLMVANISPSLSCSENTLNTLRYADRVKELKKDKETCLLNSNTNITNTPSYTNGIFTSLMSNSKSEIVKETNHSLGINESLFDKLSNSFKKEVIVESNPVKENMNHQYSSQNMYINNTNTNQKQEKNIKSQRIPLKIGCKTNLRKTIQDQTESRSIKNENKENTYFPNFEVIVSNRKEQKEVKKEEGNEEAIDFISKYNYYKTQKNNEESEKKEGILVKIRKKINEKTVKLEEMLKRNEKSQKEMEKVLDELNNKHKEYINMKVNMLKSHMENVSSVETYLKKTFIKTDSHRDNHINEYSSIISSNMSLINDEMKKNEDLINEQSKIKVIISEIITQNQTIQKEKEEISQLKQKLMEEIERFDEKEGKSNWKQNESNDSNDNIINDFINNEYDLLKKKRDFSMFFDV